MQALTTDPDEPTLVTLKAQVLMRLGRYKEAAKLYDGLLPALPERTLKWRRSTRDQAANCYRRWAKEDDALKDYDLAWSHPAEGCSSSGGSSCLWGVRRANLGPVQRGHKRSMKVAILRHTAPAFERRAQRSDGHQ